MKYTYESYKNMIKLLKENGYSFGNYYLYGEKSVILRHDVDISIERALKMAEVENELEVNSTYFVLLSSDQYNVFSKKNKNMLMKILGMGHDIGLHFDETRYELSDVSEEIELICKEADIFSEILDGYKIKSVSMHIPSKMTLEANLTIPGIVNSYSKEFFKSFKYLSDSERRWREPVLDIIKNKEYDRLHILTHPFWYNEEEINIVESVRQYVSEGKEYRIELMKPIVPSLDLDLVLGDKENNA